MSNITVHYELNTESERIQVSVGADGPPVDCAELTITDVGDNHAVTAWLDADELTDMIEMLTTVRDRIQPKYSQPDFTVTP